MTYIHATNETIIKYPFGRADLDVAYPNVSFAANPTAEDLAPFDVYPVTPTPRPADGRTERTVEAEPIITADGWQQVWTVRDATEDEIAAWDIAHRPEPQWVQFGITLATNSAFSALYDTLPATIANGLSIGLNEASKGNSKLFSGLWAEVLKLGVMDDELLLQIGELAEASHLPTAFVESLYPDSVNQPALPYPSAST